MGCVLCTFVSKSRHCQGNWQELRVITQATGSPQIRLIPTAVPSSRSTWSKGLFRSDSGEVNVWDSMRSSGLGLAGELHASPPWESYQARSGLSWPSALRICGGLPPDWEDPPTVPSDLPCPKHFPVDRYSLGLELITSFFSVPFVYPDLELSSVQVYIHRPCCRPRPNA